jgi:hypothetical protein
MKYFNNLPLISITKTDKTKQIYRNLMARVSVIPSVMDNSLAFYTYDLQHSDTPEIVAHKYYGDSYRYWIVLFCNQMLDPQWDWPLSDVALNKFITKKYANTGIDPYADVYSYKQVSTQYNPVTGQTVVNESNISQTVYDALAPYTKTISFTSEQVILTVDKRIVTYYEYENELNESKRSIKLLNKNYVPQFESEFKKLMGK